MSLKIITAGILDTVQDSGRQGYRHLGVGISGAADRHTAQLANCLLGNDPHEPLIEMHFPAASFRFNEPAVICITGADFFPEINGIRCPLNQPLAVAANCELHFTRPVKGVRCYLAVFNKLKLEKWLGSYSTNLIAKCGGLNGKKLEKGTTIHFRKHPQLNSILSGKEIRFLPWKVDPAEFDKTSVRILPGISWNDITYESQKALLNDSFEITSLSDRMGLQLQSQPIRMKQQANFLSTAVAFGTIQLLPNGQLIILMADHQTTGGYPQIAHVISADLSVLAQKSPHSTTRFTFTNQHTADMLLFQQYRYLRELKSSCDIQIQHLLNA